MTETQSLFDLSEQHGHLYLEPLKGSPIHSVALLLPSGRAAWTVNPEGLDEKQFRDRVSHEVGHAETGSFYTRWSAPTSIVAGMPPEDSSVRAILILLLLDLFIYSTALPYAQIG